MAPPLYQPKSWEDQTKQNMFGTTDLSKGQQRKFNRFEKRNVNDRLTFEATEHKKQMDSWDKAANDIFSRMRAEKTTLVPKSEATSTNNVPAAPVNPKGNTFNTAYWLGRAQKTNSEWTSIDDIKKWQSDNGLVADGKFGPKSLAKWDELKAAEEAAANAGRGILGSTNPLLRSVAPENDFDLNSNSNTKNYPTYNDVLTKNNKFFRKHYTDYRNKPITIDGKSYNVLVTRGLGKDNPLDDQTFAYDPTTGKFRMVYEDWFGTPYPNWSENSDWIDLETITNSSTATNTYNLFNGVPRNQPYYKQGGTMNRVNYFQQGGAAPQQDMQQQIIALVQAAMQGDQKATQTIEQVMQAAEAGDQQAAQLAQMIQAVMQQMQGQATAAKWGAKLAYIKSLKYAKGGKTCKPCEEGVKIEMEACGGKAKKKAKKRYFGGWI